MIGMPSGRSIVLTFGWLLLLLVCPALYSQQSPVAPVLFVCEHGSVKSLMAASYFNRKARERNLPYHAIARGTSPDEAVPEGIARHLGDDGFDVRDFKPVRVSGTDLATASRVVLIGVPSTALPDAKSLSAERWDDVPPASIDYLAARKALEQHIDQLLDELQATRH